MKTKILLFVMLTICSVNAFSQIINVPGDQPTIQAGIDAASDGDTILVAQGTYFENINFLGKAITVASHYLIEHDSASINNTIIDGSQASNPTVMFINGEDTTSIICGFTITGGTGMILTPDLGRAGGGVSCYQSGAKILNNKIINNEVTNTGYAVGGGICSYTDIGTSWVVVENNIINNNVCNTSSNSYYSIGGGIVAVSNARVENNTISENKCYNSAPNGGSDGGGLYFASPGPDTVFVKSNDIFENTLESYSCAGAGIYNVGSILHLTDNEIHNNATSGTICNGSAIFLAGIVGEVNIENNLINENTHSSVNSGAATIWISDVQNTGSRVTIKNNTINDNTATGTGPYLFGTAIWLWDLENLAVNIEANTIKSNQSTSAAGFYARNSYNYTLTNNVFKGNVSQEYGGAIYSRYASKKDDDVFVLPQWLPGSYSAKLKKTETTENKASFRPLIANNTIVENHAGIFGGAVYFSVTLDSICPVLINNIFKDNTADSLPYSVYNGGDDVMLFSHNNIDTSLVYGNRTGTGNIAGDPGFIDTLFHIDASSPCCHAGIDSVLHLDTWYYCPEFDFENQARPMPSTYMPDIGADEVDETVGVFDFSMVNSENSMKVFPNPFPTSVTIEYELQQPSAVQLAIYDYLGKQVEVIEKRQPQGKQQMIWNAEGLPAGIYFCVLKTNEGIKTTKLIKLK